MRALTVPAPAKLNLFLHVTGRRPDGYHTLESLFVALDFGDTLTLARPRRRRDRAHRRPARRAGRRRSRGARRARAAARDRARRSASTSPSSSESRVGGGLGGGSSDAASVLLALNRLWGVGSPRAALTRIGLALGADVPFFVFGDAGARARRRRAADPGDAAARCGWRCWCRRSPCRRRRSSRRRN